MSNVMVKVGKRILRGKVSGVGAFVRVHVEIEPSVWASWEFAASTVSDAIASGRTLLV